MRSRPSRRLVRSAALVLLTVAGCTYGVVSGGRVNVQRAERIYTDVQELRQLNFNADVPLVPMDQGQANLVLERELTRDHDAADLQRSAEVGVLTGLYAPGTNLKVQTMRVLSSQVVGFYDPQDREMILINSKSQRALSSQIAGFFTHKDSTSEMLIAHELTHALQDQYFGVQAALDRIVGNDDRRLALKSVAEGDAMLVGYGYVSGRVDAETIGTLTTNLDDMPKLFDLQSPDTPAALRDALIFQYTDGTRFVGEAFRRGGWNAVNALYRNPPLSTRQILDPALYFVHPSPPLTITVGGWAPALQGWHEIAENTYGELLLRVILTARSGRPGDSRAGARVARRSDGGVAKGWCAHCYLDRGVGRRHERRRLCQRLRRDTGANRGRRRPGAASCGAPRRVGARDYRPGRRAISRTRAGRVARERDWRRRTTKRQASRAPWRLVPARWDESRAPALHRRSTRRPRRSPSRARRDRRPHVSSGRNARA